MTDRRIKDLSYGRLGKPIYDSQIGWTFSQDTNLEQSIQRVLPLKEQLRPSTHGPQDSQQTAQPQFKKLVAKIPELQPGEAVAKNLSRSNHDSDWKNQGPLLAVGKGLDTERLTSRQSSFPILAMPYGDAGHILRIVRPRIEKRSWEKKCSITIPLYVVESSDEGYYNIGSAGTIEQITFSDEEDGLGSWLAVRQSTVTTILRISYSEDEDQSSVLGGVSAIKHTNLMPFSVVTFPIAQRLGQNHADVAFNSLYNRQIAIVDRSGRWSIWDNEPRHSKKSMPRLVLGKSGQILDDYDPDPLLHLPEHSLPDGWHRIFWVCNLTTILVCSRTHLAIFDIRSDPARLDNADFMVAKGIEIILDVKRSASNLNHVFVLTTSRIYWIEVVPPGENIDGSEILGGVKMLLSYRHFRNENDDSMRLSTLQDDHISVFIYSSLNHMIDFYTFSVDNDDEGDARRPQSAHSYFYLSGNEDESFNKWDKSARTIFLMPSTLERLSKNNAPRSLGDQYLEEGVRFLQPLILTTDLGLSSTLCALGPDAQMLNIIEPPLVKISRTYRRLGNRQAIEGFIVQDGEDDLEEDIPLLLDRRSTQKTNDFLMSWQHIYESVYLNVSENGEMEKANSFLSRVISSIENALTEDQMSMQTLLEASSFSKLSENLEDVRQALNEFFDSLPKDTEEALTNLVVSNTSVCPGIKLPLDGEFKPVDLMRIYEDLVDKWIASLPAKASTAIRGSKFRIIRQITAELFFSAVAISLQSKSSMVPTALPEKDDEIVGATSVGISTRESSPATFYSAQTSPGTRLDPESTLRTPTQTPSIFSRLTSASGFEEDPAISRLRQYSVSVKPRPDVGKSKILSEWPTVPGIDPATYVYKPPVQSDDEDSAPESSQSRRDSARRKKRTEKFLQKNVESSRRMTILSGSQPMGAQLAFRSQPAFSSQPTEDVPMTQPDRGIFGSRKVKGKKKQRTAGF